jgi:hypothetical protein
MTPAEKILMNRVADKSDQVVAERKENMRLKSALIDLLIACEDEFGIPTRDDGDDEPVGGGLKPDGSPDPMKITFGMLRRARSALTSPTT